ncbi:MAG: L-threonylcarbamoyladenylate synthase [Candidatus Kapaibacterium sp.]
METRIINSVELAAEEILNGNVVALPTETVYGLGADALNEDAVLKIYETKKRPDFNPLIVHVSDISEFEKYAENIHPDVYKLADFFSPGPITFILKKKSIIPDIVTAGLDTVALRVPYHELFKFVLRLTKTPIAAPSANMFGRISPTAAAEVMKELRGKINYILDGGKSTVGIESTVISFEGGRVTILRHGYITKEDVEKVIGRKVFEFNESAADNKILSPGLLKSHYAPLTPLYLAEHTFDLKRLIDELDDEKIEGLEKDSIGIMDFSIYDGFRELSKNLFSDLRNIDERHYKMIFASKVRNVKLGRAINDRLEKASVGTIRYDGKKIIFKDK